MEIKYNRVCIQNGKLVLQDTISTTNVKLQEFYNCSDIHTLINRWNRQAILQFNMKPFQPRLLWLYYV